MSRFQLLSDAQWSLIAAMLPRRRVGRAGRSRMRARWWRRSSTAIGTGSRGVICRGVRAVADGVDLASADGGGRHVGAGAVGVDRGGRRRWGGGLVGGGGLDDRPGASARDEHHPPHGGLDRITRICDPSRLITGSAALAAGCRRRSTSSSTATGCRWWSRSPPGRRRLAHAAAAAGAAAGRAAGRAAADPAGRGARRQGLLVPRDPHPPARPGHHRRDPRTPDQRATACAAAPAAGGPSASTPPTTGTATSSNDASATSSNGAASRPATTNSPRLPRRSRPQRRHRLDPTFVRHALDPAVSSVPPLRRRYPRGYAIDRLSREGAKV